MKNKYLLASKRLHFYFQFLFQSIDFLVKRFVIGIKLITMIWKFFFQCFKNILNLYLQSGS